MGSRLFGIIVATVALATTPVMATSASPASACTLPGGDRLLSGCGGGPDPCTSKAGCYSYWVD